MYIAVLFYFCMFIYFYLNFIILIKFRFFILTTMSGMAMRKSKIRMNKTNHPISSNSHPSATPNKAKHSLKIRGGYMTNKSTEYTGVYCGSLYRICHALKSHLSAPVRARGVKSRMCPTYPERDRKRRLIGAVCRNHRIKRVVPCRCFDGHVNRLG